MARNPHELPQTKDIRNALYSLEKLRENQSAAVEIRIRTASILYQTDFENDHDFLAACLLFKGFADDSLKEIFNASVWNNIQDVRKTMGSSSDLYSVLGEKHKAFLLAQLMAGTEYFIDDYMSKKENGIFVTTDNLELTSFEMEDLLYDIGDIDCPELMKRYDEICFHVKSIVAAETGAPMVDLPKTGHMTPEQFKRIGRRPF